jgi:hypothetical protein
LRPGVFIAGDFEALHFRLQGGAFKAKPVSGPARPGQQTSGFTENAEDVLAFGIVERMVARRLGRA